MKSTWILVLVTGGVMIWTGCDKPQGPPQPATPPAPKAEASTAVSAGTNASAARTSGSGNPITAPVDYLGAVAKGKTSSEKRIDSVTLNRAVQMFAATEGRYPNDLNELVKEGVLPKIPEPPYNHKYEYDPKTGTVKVVAK